MRMIRWNCLGEVIFDGEITEEEAEVIRNECTTPLLKCDVEILLPNDGTYNERIELHC